MDERAQLMNRIQVCSFALDELTLFLDTHPECTQALELFSKYQGMLKEAKEKYIAAYGPITPLDYDGSGKWKWIESPWPWEVSGV